jgi:hypothetical protein
MKRFLVHQPDIRKHQLDYWEMIVFLHADVPCITNVAVPRVIVPRGPCTIVYWVLCLDLNIVWIFKKVPNFPREMRLKISICHLSTNCLRYWGQKARVLYDGSLGLCSEELAGSIHGKWNGPFQNEKKVGGQRWSLGQTASRIDRLPGVYEMYQKNAQYCIKQFNESSSRPARIV